MNKLFIFSFLLLSTLVYSQKFPPPSGYVIDQANILKKDQEIAEKISSWEKEYKAGVEYSVVTVNTLDGYEISDYANRLFKYYGIGKRGANNGILILIAVKERKWRIEVGYGLEATITDYDASIIGKNSFFKSELKEGEYDASILRLINNLQNKIGKSSLQERTKWLEEKKHADKIASDAELSKIKNAFFDILFGLVCIFISGGSIYVLVRMFKRRQKAIREHDKIKDKLGDLISTVMMSDLQCYINYSSVYSLFEYAQLLDMKTKKMFFWTSSIVNHTKDLNNDLTSLKFKYSHIQKKVLTLNKISDLKIDIINELTQHKGEYIVDNFFNFVDNVSILDLDDDIEMSYRDLKNKFTHIFTILEAKKYIKEEYSAIQNSELNTLWYNHIGVQDFINNLSKYKKLPLSDDLIDIKEKLTHTKLDLLKDISDRKHITKNVFDFSKFDTSSLVARAIIQELNLPETLNMSFLSVAKESYRKLTELINAGESVIDKNWDKIKELWNIVQSNTQKHEQEVSKFTTKKAEYVNAIKNIPVLKNQIINNINDGKSKVNLKGISNNIKSKFTTFVNMWNNYNSNTSGLSALELILLFTYLNRLSSELFEILNKAKSEHQTHLDELEREKRRKKREADEEESRARARQSSLYTSSSYSSSSFNSSSDSFSGYGGGSSGGGGASGGFDD